MEVRGRARTTCAMSTSTSAGRAGSADRRGRVGQELLITGSVAGRDEVVMVDQGRSRDSRRSNPRPTGLLEPIRKAFAKANGVKPALFSANSEGVPDVQWCRRDLHRPGDDGRRGDGARNARASASRLRASTTPSAARTSPRCSIFRCPRRWTSSPLLGVPAAQRFWSEWDVGSGLPASATADDALRRERQRLKLAPQMADKGTSTSSTSRRPACTSPMSEPSACSTGSSTAASRSS